jgi:hypothetical protein
LTIRFYHYTKARMSNRATTIMINQEETANILKECVRNYVGFLDKNPEYSLEVAKKRNTDKVCFIQNESYVALRYKQEKNIKMKDEKGTIRNYIWDKKEKIYKTKKNDRIVLPNICSIVECEEVATFYKEYGLFGEGDKHFHTSVLNGRAENHTGNHHRNHFVKVPPRAIGR